MIKILFLLLLFTSCALAQTSRTLQSPNGKVSKDSMAANLSANQKVTIPISIDGKQYVVVSAFSASQTYQTGDLLYANGNVNFVNRLSKPTTSSFLGALPGDAYGPHWYPMSDLIPFVIDTNYVLTNPNSTTIGTHNAIQNQNDAQELILHLASAGQTANAFEWQDSAGVLMGSINARGAMLLGSDGNYSGQLYLSDPVTSHALVTAQDQGGTPEQYIIPHVPGGALFGMVGSGGGLLTAGSGISITNSLGLTTIATSGVGTVTSITAGTGLTASPNPITTSGTISLSTPVAIANGGTGQTTAAAAFDALAPTTTDGDIIYRNSTTNTRLGAGAAYYPLVIDHVSGRPAWQQLRLDQAVQNVLPEANGGTNQSTYTTGDMLYASATNTLSKRAIGSTNQVLAVSGGVPTWMNVTATLPDSISPQWKIYGSRWSWDTTGQNLSGGTSNAIDICALSSSLSLTTPMLVSVIQDTNGSRGAAQDRCYGGMVDSIKRATGQAGSLAASSRQNSITNNTAVGFSIVTATTCPFPMGRVQYKVSSPANSNNTYDTTITISALGSQVVIVTPEAKVATTTACASGAVNVNNLRTANITSVSGTSLTLRLADVTSSIGQLANDQVGYFNYGLFTTDSTGGVFARSVSFTNGTGSAQTNIWDTITDAQVNPRSRILLTCKQDANSEANVNYVADVFDSTQWPSGKFIVRMARSFTFPSTIANGKGCTLNYVVINAPTPATTILPLSGRATLASGTATVNVTSIQASDLVFVTPTSNSSLGSLYVTVTAGTGFTVTSTNGSDASAFNWIIIRPN